MDAGAEYGVDAGRNTLPKSLGWLVFENRSREPLILDRVVPKKVDSELKILGFRAYTPTEIRPNLPPSYPPGEIYISTWCGFPPRNLFTHPVAGYEVPAGKWFGIFVGVDTYAFGQKVRVENFVIHYTIGGRRYRQLVEYTMGVTLVDDSKSMCPDDFARTFKPS